MGKMKKVLILANTYFQIMIAIKLKLTIYKNDNVDIIISNHSNNAEDIVVELEKEKNIFEKSYFFQSKKNIDKKSLLRKVCDDLLYIITPEKALKQFNIEMERYDEFVFYNIDKYTYLLYDCLFQTNNFVKLIRYEEGYVSYLYLNIGISKIYKLLRKIFKKRIIEDNIKDNLLFNPDLLVYKPKENIKKIDKFSKNDINFKSIVNNIFNYSNDENAYKRKYIFFEESFFCDGKEIDDLNLILNIAEIVGKENLLVKLHPRNKINRFEKYGIKTNKTIGIPWEIIQLNNDFSNNVFLTISSGSVLASQLYFNEKIKTYLLFNCTDNKSNMVTTEYFEYFNKLNNKYDLQKFSIPKNKKEFFEELKNDL